MRTATLTPEDKDIAKQLTALSQETSPEFSPSPARSSYTSTTTTTTMGGAAFMEENVGYDLYVPGCVNVSVVLGLLFRCCRQRCWLYLVLTLCWLDIDLALT